MYKDAKEELKRLEEALLEGETVRIPEEEIAAYDFDRQIREEEPQVQPKKVKKDRDVPMIILTVAASLVLAGVTAGLVYMLICYGRAVL